MHITWTHYYGLMQKLSHFSGMWPYMKPRTKMFRIAIVTITAVSMFIPQIAYTVMCNGDLQCIFESITSYSFTLTVFISIYTFQLNIDKIKKLIEASIIDWKELETSEELKIMKSYAEYSKRYSMIIWVYCCIASIFFTMISFIPPLLDFILPLNDSRPLILPYPAYYFVDSRMYLIYIWLHAVIAFEMGVTCVIATVCIFVTYVEHICCMFTVIGCRFECLFRNFDKIVENSKIDTEKVYCNRFAFIVRTHRKTLVHAKLLQSIFNLPFGAQLIVDLIALSSTFLQVNQESNILKLLKYTLYIGGQVIHLFYLSFEGQKLINHSLQMYDKIYKSSWYKAPIKLQKLFMLVMIQCRPTCLSAANIYILSLENFSTVMKTAMSYFMVLASFQ